MIQTADNVAQRYGVSRDVQDAYALESQRRTAAAQQARKFDDEIVPLTAEKVLYDKEGKVTGTEMFTLTRDEGNRPETNIEGLAKLKPVAGPDKFITAGNASQLSDGSSAAVVMSDREAQKRGLKPLGIYRGFEVAGCEPDEMGIGPVFAIPKLLKGSKYKKELYMDTLALLYDLLVKARKQGMMALEGDVDKPESSEIFGKYPNLMADHHLIEFITDYLRLLAAGSITSPYELDALMDVELETHHHDGHQPAAALTRVCDGLPGFGIVAAVLGIVITMGAIGGPPAELGHHVAAALVGTFLGILLAYGFVGPMATAVEHMAADEAQMFLAIKNTLVASAQGYAPQIAIEFGRKAIGGPDRPSFSELENRVKGK